MVDVPDRITSTSQLRELADALRRLCGSIVDAHPRYSREVPAGISATLRAHGADPADADAHAELVADRIRDVSRAAETLRVCARELEDAADVVRIKDSAVRRQQGGTVK